MDKDLKKILKAAEKQGYEVRRTRRGHIRVIRDGRTITVFAGTASDHRSMKNALAPLKRDGFQWPPPK